jgi:hypothetical protein
MSCSYNPLNGLPLGGNTEGGRLDREQARCAKNYTVNKASSPACCSPYKNSVQATITQNSANYTSDLSLGCSVKGGVTGERVRQLLASVKGSPYNSQGVRIAAIQQAVLNCSTNLIPSPIIIQACPPLPPPPGPPYICRPAKNPNY